MRRVTARAGGFVAQVKNPRKGPGGTEVVVMPISRYIVRTALGAGQGDGKLLSAIIDQESGAVMIAARFVDGTQPRGLEIDEVWGARTIRHLSS